MQFSLWLALLGAGVVISFTPGAGAINTMSNSLNVGLPPVHLGHPGPAGRLGGARGRSWRWASGVLVASSPLAFNVIRYAGAAYLVYLGIRQFLAKPDQDGGRSGRAANEPACSMFRRGLWVNLLNPKAIVFFLAFMPQFIRPDQPLLPQYMVLTATVIADGHPGHVVLLRRGGHSLSSGSPGTVRGPEP